MFEPRIARIAQVAVQTYGYDRGVSGLPICLGQAAVVSQEVAVWRLEATLRRGILLLGLCAFVKEGSGNDALRES